ncbi:MAG: 23S rRNA (uracil(1939)-C(5))-methyltransferase RlmD [Myxococcales bacterium]|nr:23S rRNA (uracil(1939)-C(5))-methyltransferase RlmD [Myxococcales bacterium]
MSAPGKPSAIEVSATDLDDDGAGVATVDGRTLHVADLLPGERARVAWIHQSKQRPEAWGRIVTRTSPPSPDRVKPPCPAFGRCGGCPWQHLAYPAQLAAKHRQVARALGDQVTPAAVVPAPHQLHYRAKGKYVAGRTDGHLALGAWARDRHQFVDTAGCQVVTRAIDRVRGAVIAAAAGARLAPFDEQRGTGQLRYAIIRQARDGRLLVALVVRSNTPAVAVAAAGRALIEDPTIVGVVRIDNDRTDGALAASPPVLVAGDATLPDRIAGVDVALGATEFAQVNPVATDALYAHVAAQVALAPGERAADVYAGLGGISFALARAGATVTAIERDASAIAALTAAATAAGLAITGVVGDAEVLAERGADLAAIVVNPPRKGCSAATLAAATASTAGRLVYVSCGPDALGRDLRALTGSGWRIDHAQPFDLMPGTAQVETVVRLVR